MVNKILTLFDMEFKRIQKIFFTMVSLMILANVGIFILGINRVIADVKAEIGFAQGVSVLKTEIGKYMFLQLQLPRVIYTLSNFMMILALIGCVFYSILIWYRDFSSKSKSIYTLFMLPENRFIIFISKLITMLTLIYSIVFIQHLCWGVEFIIVSRYADISIINMLDSINNIGTMPGILNISVPMYSMEYLMIFIIGPIIGVTAIFVAVLMSKSIKKVGGILGAVYIIVFAILDLIIIFSQNYSDIILRNNNIFYILIFLVSIFISYNLLQRKLYD